MIPLFNQSVITTKIKDIDYYNSQVIEKPRLTLDMVNIQTNKDVWTANLYEYSNGTYHLVASNIPIDHICEIPHEKGNVYHKRGRYWRIIMNLSCDYPRKIHKSYFNINKCIIFKNGIEVYTSGYLNTNGVHITQNDTAEINLNIYDVNSKLTFFNNVG